jgi:RNA polymerase sigma-70 factor (ECF subfamily)
MAHDAEHEQHPSGSRSTDARSDFLARFLEIETSLYRYVCVVAPVPQDARDIVQETALALWEHDDCYDPSRPFLPWALRVARNKARQHAEKAGRFPRLLGDEALLDLIVSEGEEFAGGAEDRQAYLRQCLEKLQPDHFQLIKGYYWQRKGIEPLAREMKTTVEGIYKRLQRIRGQLEKCIQMREQQEATS